VIYTASMLRHASWIRPAGESPAPVGTGAPGSRPQPRGETPAAERGVESLFGGSKRAGWDCSLVKVTTGEPSRSCHGEGHARQSWFRARHGGSPRGTETCTRARSDRGTWETRLASLVSKDRPYKPKAKGDGGKRESEGVVVVPIGVQKNAPGAKGPRFDRACGGRKRKGMAALKMRSHYPAGYRPGEWAASEMAPGAPRRPNAREPQSRLRAAAKRSRERVRSTREPCRGDFPQAALPCLSLGVRVAAPGGSSVSRVRENRTHGLKGERGNRPTRVLRP
jgi:hypothetical protein